MSEPKRKARDRYPLRRPPGRERLLAQVKNEALEAQVLAYFGRHAWSLDA